MGSRAHHSRRPVLRRRRHGGRDGRLRTRGRAGRDYRGRRRLGRPRHHRSARSARRRRPHPARAPGQRRRRVGAARGLRRGESPYVFVLASDDLADSGALGELADALDRSPEYDFAYGHSHHFGDVDFVRKAAPWNPWILLHSNLWEATCLFRREAVNAAGGSPMAAATRTGICSWRSPSTAARACWSTGWCSTTASTGGERINPGIKLRFREHYATLRRHHPALFAREQGAGVALPAAALVAPALSPAARGRAASAAGARAPAARRQAPPAPARRLGRRRAPLARPPNRRRPARARAARRPHAAPGRARR